VVATHAPPLKALLLPPALAVVRALVMPVVELARGRPAMAWAHLTAAVAGLGAAAAGLSRRVRGDVVPARAAPAARPRSGR
jgi:hypothetical protein